MGWGQRKRKRKKKKEEESRKVPCHGPWLKRKETKITPIQFEKTEKKNTEEGDF